MTHGLETILNGITKELADREVSRESTMADSRKVIRLSKKVIHAVHNGEDHSVARKEMHDIVGSLDRNETSAADAMMEFSEAEILVSIVEGRRLPSPEDLGIDGGSWLMGMADAIGELRRVILTLLMDSDLNNARSLFLAMEELCEGLMMFDVPDAILPIRRKQDVARSLLERTRSDLLNATLSFSRD